MSNPLVSAVITTYKRSGTMLMQAVQSARSQTYRPLEIIVVSDNPPESGYAREVAEALCEYPEVRLIQMERNSGAQAARNAGIRAASGEFIALLDDDDQWMPEKTELQMPAFSDPEVGLVYCRGYVLTDATDRLSDYYTTTIGFRTSARFEDLLRDDIIGSTSQAIVRRKCFDDCGYFDEAFRARQDYDRWLAITQKYKAVGIDRPLFVNRNHEGERITGSMQVAIEAYATIYAKYSAHFHRHPDACMSHYYRMAVKHRMYGKKPESLYYYLRALLWNPVAFLKKYRIMKQRHG